MFALADIGPYVSTTVIAAVCGLAGTLYAAWSQRRQRAAEAVSVEQSRNQDNSDYWRAETMGMRAEIENLKAVIADLRQQLVNERAHSAAQDGRILELEAQLYRRAEERGRAASNAG